MNELADFGAMLIGAQPGALVWPAALIVWGPGAASAGHSHHCVQLVMALAETLRVRAGPGKRWLRCEAALVRPDAAHEVDANGVTALMAFVDPQSELGAALAERIDEDIACVPSDEVAAWRGALGEQLEEGKVERWVKSQLLRRRRPTGIDPRITRALRYVHENIAAPESLSLPKVAAVAGLSPSRFMHVFTQAVGVPLRPYVLWRRLQRATGELMSGASATHAAHEAGFADAAHLTRTFKRMLGTSPSELVQRRPASRAIAI